MGKTKMTRFRQLSFALLLVGLVAGCAKERDLKPVAEDASRIQKNHFQNGPYLYQKSVAGVRNAGPLVPLQAVGIYLIGNEIVNFEITENHLNVVALDPLFTSDGVSTNRRLASFKVEHLDVLRKQNVDGKDTHEEEVTQTRRPWNERDYLKVDFTQDAQDEFGAENVSLIIPPRTVELDHERNAINFVITKELRDGSQIEIRHSFLKFTPSETYEQKAYPREVQDRFGIFKTKTYKFDKYGQVLQKDLKEYMNRWDTSKKIVYYFSGNYPEHLKKATREVFANWNKAWKAATGKEVLEIRENSGQKVGDIRYNLIHYDDTPGGSRLLGYGPSVTNPRTGEIIKADVFLYGSTLKRSVRSTRLWAEAFGQPKPSILPLVPPSPGTKTSLLSLGPQFSTVDLANFETFADTLDGKGVDSQILNHFFQKNGKVVKLEAMLDTARKTISGAMDERTEKLVQNTIHLDENMLASIREGVLVNELDDDELEVRIFMPLLAHEMGHNFGLRHNFMGSADKKHFDHDTKTSSVMDYAFAAHEPLGPAAYDKAVLKLAYSNETNALEKFDKQNFYFCTDHQAFSSRSMMCARHDAGTSLMERIKTMKKRYEINYEIFNKRMGRAFFDNSASSYIARISTFLMPFRLMYDHASAIVEAAEEGSAQMLWQLLKQRIEADPSTTRPVPFRLPGRMVALDQDKIQEAVQDAAQARVAAYTALVQVLAGVTPADPNDPTSQPTRKPDYDQADVFNHELVTKGVLYDKILAVMMLGARSAHPINGTPVTMYEGLSEPLAELFKTILSNSAETETGSTLIFSNPNVREFAKAILAEDLGRPGQLTAESIELIRLEPTNGSAGEQKDLGDIEALRDLFREIIKKQNATSIGLMRLQLDANEAEAILKTPNLPDSIRVQVEKALEGTKEKIETIQQWQKLQAPKDEAALKEIAELRREINVAVVKSGHREFRAPLNLAEIELGLDLDTASGALIKNNLNFVEDLLQVFKELRDDVVQPEVEKAEKAVEANPQSQALKVSLQRMQGLQESLSDQIVTFRRYVQMEKRFIADLYRIYDMR